MSRLIVVMFLSIMLFGCSSQSETWTWIFENGTVIEFPDSWELIADEGFYGVTVNDGYGNLGFTPFGFNHDAWEQAFFEDYEDGVEIDTDGNVRIFRAETVIENLVEHYNGVTEFIDYVVLVPNDFVLSVYVPITPDFIEREPTIQQALQSITALHNDLNIFSFHGGQAVMAYSDAWSLEDRNVGLGVTMKTDDLSLGVWVEDSEFWLVMADKDEAQSITHADVIHAIPNYDLSEDALIQYTSRRRYRLAIYQDEAHQVVVFHLNNGLWFKITLARRDSGVIQAEDEAIVMQMIDSILLNNRSSYDEPINLRLPSQ